MYGLNLDANAGGARITGLIADIEQNYRIILSTRQGDKIGDPGFGCKAWDKLDSPATQIPAMIGDVVRALNRDEPRAVVQSVVPDFSGVPSGQVIMTITYRIIDTGQVLTMALNYTGV